MFLLIGCFRERINARGCGDHNEPDRQWPKKNCPTLLFYMYFHSDVQTKKLKDLHDKSHEDTCLRDAPFRLRLESSIDAPTQRCQQQQKPHKFPILCALSLTSATRLSVHNGSRKAPLLAMARKQHPWQRKTALANGLKDSTPRVRYLGAASVGFLTSASLNGCTSEAGYKEVGGRKLNCRAVVGSLICDPSAAIRVAYRLFVFTCNSIV